MNSKTLIDALLNTNDFPKTLKDTIKKNGLNIKEFCKLSSIPLNTLYKIVSDGKKDFKISTLKKIYQTIKKLEGKDKEFIAVIAPRVTLGSFNMNEVIIKKRRVRLKGYDITNLLDVITQSIKAEKDGAVGIICGPIAANVIEEIVQIPLSCLTDSAFDKALENIKLKIK